jgi:hypothetical protein
MFGTRHPCLISRSEARQSYLRLTPISTSWEESPNVRQSHYLAHFCSDYLAHYRFLACLGDSEERMKPRFPAEMGLPHTFSPPIRSWYAK